MSRSTVLLVTTPALRYHEATKHSFHRFARSAGYLDWATQLAYAPGKRIQLVDKAMRKAMRFTNYLQKYAVSGGKAEDCIEPLPQDHRFTDEAWHKFPFNFIYQSFLLQQQWWHNATTGLRGVSKSH